MSTLLVEKIEWEIIYIRGCVMERCGGEWVNILKSDSLVRCCNSTVLILALTSRVKLIHGVLRLLLRLVWVLLVCQLCQGYFLFCMLVFPYVDRYCYCEIIYCRTMYSSCRWISRTVCIVYYSTKIRKILEVRSIPEFKDVLHQLRTFSRWVHRTTLSSCNNRVKVGRGGVLSHFFNEGRFREVALYNSNQISSSLLFNGMRSRISRPPQCTIRCDRTAQGRRYYAEPLAPWSGSKHGRKRFSDTILPNAARLAEESDWRHCDYTVCVS